MRKGLWFMVHGLLIKNLRKFGLIGLISLIGLIGLVSSCTIEPPLHLPDEGTDIESDMPLVQLDVDLLWSYDMVIDSITGEIYDSTYNWRDDFVYGWDDEDDRIFGTWDLQDPEVFNIRRYYKGESMYGARTAPLENQIEGTSLIAHYQYGFYDILAWNEVTTIDGVQSIHFDETTTYDYVTAYTNASMNRAYHTPKHAYAYYQPEFLFGGTYDDLEITNNPDDYDYFDEIRKVYVKNIDMLLLPRTYIYVTQIILHHNNGRVSNIDGTANLTGMASKTNVNTGVTNDDEISVNYNQRLKHDINFKGENVDIIGGRLFTFGLCNLNPSRATRASARDNTSKNYIEINMTFNNGTDSTYVFDVTDQVHRRYKGGILTVELDVDTLKYPTRSGGSGFDAVVEDYDSVKYEFDMAKARKVKAASPQPSPVGRMPRKLLGALATPRKS